MASYPLSRRTSPPPGSTFELSPFLIAGASRLGEESLADESSQAGAGDRSGSVPSPLVVQYLGDSGPGRGAGGEERAEDGDGDAGQAQADQLGRVPEDITSRTALLPSQTAPTTGIDPQDRVEPVHHFRERCPGRTSTLSTGPLFGATQAPLPPSQNASGNCPRWSTRCQDSGMPHRRLSPSAVQAWAAVAAG